MSDYKNSFFVVPSRILELPDLTLAFLRIYETIFQFWNHGKNCYLTNEKIMERTGIKSESTIREAFIYFEKHNEMKRLTKGKRRYLIQPERQIEVENEQIDNLNYSCLNNTQGVDLATPTRRHVDALPVAKSTHKNNNLNNKNIKREEEHEIFSLLGNETDYSPDEDDLTIGEKFKIDLHHTFEKFIIDLKRKKKKKFIREDWKLWLRREVKYKQSGANV